MAYSKKIRGDILERISEGESLRSICSDKGMPAKSAVMRWLTEDPEFQDQYARAREAQADTLFDEILGIVDGAKPEDVAAARLRMDARKWMAGKLRPKKYGDKLAIGGDQDMDPIKTEETGAASAKLSALIDAIAERSGTTG